MREAFSLSRLSMWVNAKKIVLVSLLVLGRYARKQPPKNAKRSLHRSKIFCLSLGKAYVFLTQL